MKIFLNNDNTGGSGLTVKKLTFRSALNHYFYLIGMPAKLISLGCTHVRLTYFYDILGKGDNKNIKHSLLKKV